MLLMFLLGILICKGVICDEFGVLCLFVFEVIMWLVLEGFVDVILQSGMCVVWFFIEEICEVVFMCEVFEVVVVEKVVWDYMFD